MARSFIRQICDLFQNKMERRCEERDNMCNKALCAFWSSLLHGERHKSLELEWGSSPRRLRSEGQLHEQGEKVQRYLQPLK